MLPVILKVVYWITTIFFIFVFWAIWEPLFQRGVQARTTPRALGWFLFLVLSDAAIMWYVLGVGSRLYPDMP